MGSDLRQTQALNLDFLTRQTFGDRTLERELLALFLRQCVRLLPIVSGAAPTVERADAAHTLKGAALAIGAARIASLAGTLEGALDSEMPDATLRRLVTKLEGAIEETREAIAMRWRAAA